MEREEDPDAELLVDWRSGHEYAKALRVPPQQQQQQQSMLPFKQKKATSGDSAATKKVTTDNITTMKKEGSWPGSGAAAATTVAVPVVYDLSDSEGAPIPLPLVVSSKPGRKAAAALKPCKVESALVSQKCRDNAEVVDLGSDSDEDISPGAMAMRSGKLDKSCGSIPQPGILDKSISLDGEGMVNSIPRIDLTAAAAHVFGLPLTRAVASSSLNPLLVDGEGMVSSIPRTDVSSAAAADLPLTRFAASSSLNPLVVDGEGMVSSIPRTDVASAAAAHVSGLISVSASHCNLLTSFIPSSSNCPNAGATELLKQLDPTQGAMRDCLQPMQGNSHEGSRRCSPVHQEFADLTVDDDGYGSEPEWLRNHEPAALRGSWNSGGAGAHSLRAEDLLQQNLPTLETIGGNGELGDGSAGKKRMPLNIPGLEPLGNHETNFVICLDDEEGSDGILSEGQVKRKRSRAIRATGETLALDDEDSLENIVPGKKKSTRGRKGPVSEEELAAREAEKKARQEENRRAREEKKDELKRQKEAAKAEATERRNLDKEKQRWAKGKFALENTTVYLDTRLIEIKGLGNHVIEQLGGKKYNYKLEVNPIAQTIVWRTKRCSGGSQADAEGFGSQNEDLLNSNLSNSQLQLEEVEIKYVVVVLQGEVFSTMVAERKFQSHLSSIRKQYPRYSICYLINRLKREHHHHEVLAELITNCTGVQSRVCADEADLASHIVGLTKSLAEAPFKPDLTVISITENGGHVKKDPNKDIIKKSSWLKILVAIPNIPGAIAIAIAKKYPTMRDLLNVYLDPRMTDHLKEILLKDIVKDVTLGAERPEGRRVGPVASKRIYRVLMAKDGNVMTEDAEEGADSFTGTDV